ncbi:cytochrome P450 [Amycolatopsis japonica]|uniref:cytochrome P450 n=1 Tax=Amycolatopsis japonica TaxID=208439 RepID=UPI003806B8DF
MLPPGPKGKLLSGNISAYEKDRLGFIVESSREFGDVWMFDRRIAVAAAPGAADEVYRRTYQDFVPDRNFLHRRQKEDPKLQEQWAHSRASRMRGMRPKALQAKVPILAGAIAEHLDTWAADGTLDVVPDMRKLTSQLGARLCFGRTDAAIVAGGEQDLFWALLPVIASPVDVPPWVPTRRNRKVAAANRELERRIQTVIDRRRAGQRSAEDDLLGIVMTPTGRSGQLDDQLICETLIATMLAAQGAPAPGMAWIFHLLAEHPGVQDQVAAEALRVLPDGPDIRWEQSGKLAFTEQVVKEVMRLWPPNWLSGRQVVRRTTVGKYDLLPGMMMMVAPYVIHRDPRWFSDPETFKPDRWQKGGETEDLPECAYAPFGAGPLICMGLAWSMIEMTLLTAMVVRRFRINAVPGCVVTPDASREITPSGLRLRFTERKGSLGTEPSARQVEAAG